MVKIKLKLFEGIVACTIFPNTVFFFNTILLIISLFQKQNSIVYKTIAFTYIVCVALLLISLAICFIINRNSKKEFILRDNSFEIYNTTHELSDVISCEYFVCKWYAIPIVFFYKQQAGGLFEIKLGSGEKIYFKLLYSDYLKIKDRMPNVKEK